MLAACAWAATVSACYLYRHGNGCSLITRSALVLNTVPLLIGITRVVTSPFVPTEHRSRRGRIVGTFNTRDVHGLREFMPRLAYSAAICLVHILSLVS